MSQSGVKITGECVDVFEALKLRKEMKYIIYKISDDNKNIVVEETSNNPDWEVFRDALSRAQTKDKRGNLGKGPRYAVYDVQYELPDGEGTRNKLAFIAWSPDDAGIHAKMLYASSKDALRRSLTGIGVELQANDVDDIEYDEIVQKLRKGGR